MARLAFGGSPSSWFIFVKGFFIHRNYEGVSHLGERERMRGKAIFKGTHFLEFCELFPFDLS